MHLNNISKNTLMMFLKLNTFIFSLPFYMMACRAVAMQWPQDGRIYQTRFWATAVETECFYMVCAEML
jgi:hypothetical protein